MAQSPLGADAIVRSMAEALPNHEKGDTTSDLSSSYEAIALFTHACMVNLGFRLLGFDEDGKLETECQNLTPRLPPKWNTNFNSYSFVYAHSQSAKTYVVRIDRMGPRAEIRGLASGSDKVARVDFEARKYVSSSTLPVRIPLDEDGNEKKADGNGGDARTSAELSDKLRAVFISPEHVADLASLIKVSIVQQLVPDLLKEGYSEETTDADDRAAEDDARRPLRETYPDRHPPRSPRELPDPMPRPAQPYPRDDPLAVQPRQLPRPVADFPPPDFEDEHEINRPHARGGVPLPMPGRSPFDIGHDDLNPPGLGPHDPLRGSFIGGGGLPRPGGGGMHPTFDDPLFDGPRGGSGGGGGGEGGMFDPQIPPGARWDPLGPGTGPRGPRRGGLGGSSGSPFGGGFGGGIL